MNKGYDIAPPFPNASWLFELDDGECDFSDTEDSEIKRFDAADRLMKYVLNDIPGEKLFPEYDYGDGWKISVILENVFEDKELPGRELPRVLAGEGYGIVEKCGGFIVTYMSWDPSKQTLLGIAGMEIFE